MRLRERRSIRGNARHLRECVANGGYLAIGRGGWTLHIADGHTLSGYGADTDGVVLAALHLGIPCIDSRSVPDSRIVETVRLPMVGLSRVDPAPWGALSYAPLAYVAEQYRRLGAMLTNF